MKAAIPMNKERPVPAGPGTVVGANVVLTGILRDTGDITIHGKVEGELSTERSVTIGETAEIHDDCTIYQGVTLGGVSLLAGKRHPTLERGVVVGAGAQVLGPFVVGEGAKIGSNAVVTKPVPAWATAVGNPARMILKTDTSENPSEHFTQDSATRTKAPFASYGLTQKRVVPVV